MTNPFTDSFNAIDAEIAAAMQADDAQKEIETRGAKAAKHLIKFQFKRAAKELGKVAALVGDTGQVEHAATAKFAQARAYGQMENGLDLALDSAKMAAELAEKGADLLLRGDISLYAGKLYAIKENYLESFQALSHAVEMFGVNDLHPEKLIEALRLRAGVGVFLLLFDQARVDLAAALELTNQSGWDELAAEIQTQQEAVELFAQGDLTADRLSQLLELGSRLGDHQFRMEPNLQKALEKLKQKKIGAAEKLAQKSFDQARQNKSQVGYIQYFAASVVLAEIQAAADNKVDVLKTLLRCKVYVEQKIDPAMGQFVDQYLNSFQDRWGAETLQQTILEYQDWIAENGPVPA